jgi:hypothetical protein
VCQQEEHNCDECNPLHFDNLPTYASIASLGEPEC